MFSCSSLPDRLDEALAEAEAMGLPKALVAPQQRA